MQIHAARSFWRAAKLIPFPRCILRASEVKTATFRCIIASNAKQSSAAVRFWIALSLSLLAIA
jgi:hypothetical protein